MVFKDRIQAGELLAERLSRYKGKHPLVLGVPRGAVPMAGVIAGALGGELDIVLVRKLAAPEDSEHYIGSVNEAGDVYVSPEAEARGIAPRYIAREAQWKVEKMRRRRVLYGPHCAPLDPAERIAIVVDDGVATGSTLIAALRAVRAHKPARLIAAVGVSPSYTVLRLRKECDELVCLTTAKEFLSVGRFFDDYRRVTDDDIIRVLRSFRATHGIRGRRSESKRGPSHRGPAP